MPDGSVVRVKDVARVEMGAKSQDRYSRFNGAPAAALGIYQTPGSNAVDVTRNVRDALNTLATRFPEDLAYNVFFDSTVFVTSTIEEVIRTLAVAIVLVALVVFLFLGRWRTTLIPLVAVPVSIIGTFAVMLAIGYSANTVSLLALVLAIGIVVDDAIVVVENVERVIEEEPELPVPEACKKAMAEITGPILAITLVLLSVFVPVAFIPGISGQLFRQFAVAVSVVDADLGAQRPDAQSGALRGAPEARPDEPRPDALCPRRRSTAFARRLRGGGAPAGARGDRRRRGRGRRAGGLGVAVQQDAAELPAGRGSGRHLRGAAASGRRLAQPHRGGGQGGRRHRRGRFPGVEGVLSVVGLNFIDYVASSNQAFFVIRLKPYEARTDRAQSAGAIIARLRPQMAAIKGAIAFPFNLPPILGLGSTGGFQYVLEALQGQPPTDVAATLRGLIVAANGQPELAGVFSTYAADTPQIYLDIDRDKAQVLGVKISDIFSALQSTLGSFYVNDFNVFGRTWQVNIQAETSFRDNSRRHLPHLRAQRTRRNGPDPRGGRGEAGARAADGDPLQRISRRDRERRGEARLQLRPGARRDGAHLRLDAARRLQLRMDRHRAAGKGGERTHRHRARAGHPVRLFVSRRAVRELEHSRCRRCCRSASRCSAPSSRWCWRD